MEVGLTTTSEHTTRYEQLLERATEFIAQNGGLVHEDQLIRQVFGASGKPDLWRSLLRQILNDSTTIGLRGDGYWTIVEASDNSGNTADELGSDSFVVVDVETTGLKPLQHRVIEFGAVRYEEGRQSDTLSLLIQPERSIPKYVRSLTGIDETLLVDSPLFSDVADQILEFIQDATLVGYNVGFDVAFLNAELVRIQRPSLLNHTIDLLPAARALMPGTRARGLTTLAKELGVSPTGAHRALDDALTTAAVLERLMPRIRAAGITSINQLDGFKSPFHPKRTGTTGPLARGRSLLDPEYIDRAPASPGVYKMLGADKRVLYVGKARDLRSRIRSYYSQPLGYTRKMDGLLQSIQQIETIETGSELGALLLEAQLIARYRPQFNRQMRTSEHYPYIRVDTKNPWPRVHLVKEVREDGARYYGPYRSSRSARATVDAINDVYPLRSCSRSFKTQSSYGSPCTDLDLGRCLGPCTGLVDRDEYFQFVREILRFLDGECEPVFDRLHTQLERAAERLDFEKAARIRNRIERVTELSRAQSILSEAVWRGDLAIVLAGAEPNSREIMLTRFGRAWSRRVFDLNEPNTAVGADLQRSWDRAQRLATSTILQRELDSVQILVRWVRTNWGHPSIVSIEDSVQDWTDFVEIARTVELIA
jgi:DNA polymerase III subunit epsilon